MKQKIMKIITVIMLIITLTMVNLIMLCANAITYAVESVNAEKSTSHKNVEFMAYFKDANGNKITEEEVEMNREDLKMYFQIAVKQEGYYNGRIEIKDANFKFKKEKTNEIINEIEENKISLKQINAGETREIEVGIELKKEEEYDIGLIEKESVIGIEGIYRDSTEKDIEIKGERKVKIKIKSPYTSEEQRKISQEIITNKVIRYNGEEKRIIQIKVTGNLEGNLYPVKRARYEIEIPEIEGKEVEDVKVHSDEKQVTNGKEITKADWEYNKEEGRVVVEINNKEKENKVVWKKEGEDSFIVTYIYDEEVKVKEGIAKITSEIELYDTNKTIIETEEEDKIGEEEKDRIIETEIEQREKEIYKGKLESGIEREITYKNTIKINLEKVANKIEITEENQRIKGEKLDAEIETEYKITIIDKEQINKILGQEGNLTIRNQETQEIIHTINKETEADETGKILVVYPKGIKVITMQIENADNIGKVEIESTKIIKNLEEIVKEANTIESKITGIYTTTEKQEIKTSKVQDNIQTQQEKIQESKSNQTEEKQNIIEEKISNINLQETQTEATLEINKTELSTMTTNENVEFRIVLKTQNEQNELYKNAKIKLELPEKIKEIKVNSINVLYEEELKVKTAILKGKTIEIELEGEQTRYKEEAIEGTTIIINANLGLDKKDTSSEEQVKLIYTNEKATKYTNEGTQGEKIQPIKIIAYSGIVTTNEIKEYGIEQVNNEGETTGKLEVAQEAKTAKITKQIINNKDNKIKDLKIMGTFPTKEAVEGTNNINMKVASPIEVTGIEQGREKIYYTENVEATDDITKQENGWKETIEDGKTIKKYLVQINELEKQEEIGLEYSIEIPENLEYNKVAEEGYEVNYTNETALQETVKQQNLRLTTGQGPVLTTILKAYIGGELVNNDSKVKTGEVIKYEMAVTNSGTENAINAKIVGKVPDGTVYVEPLENSEYTGENYYNELVDIKTVEKTAEIIKIGETKYYTYEVRVKQDTTQGSILNNKVTVEYNNISQESNEINNQVEEGRLRITVKRVTDKDIDINSESKVKVCAILENVSNSDISNVKVKLNTDELSEITWVGITDDVNILAQEVEYKGSLNIEKLPANSFKLIYAYIKVKNTNNEKTQNIVFNATASIDDEEYRANNIGMEVNNIKISLEQISKNENTEVKSGEKVEYEFVLKNLSDIDILGAEFYDNIPKELKVLDVYVNEEQVKTYSNEIIVNRIFRANSETKIKIIAELSEGEEAEVKQLINYGKVTMTYKEIAVSNEIKIIANINAESEDKDDGDKDDGDKDDGDEDDNEKYYNIGGTAWLDQNDNGAKETNEKLLKDIKVKLLDTTTNTWVRNKSGNIIETRTSEKGDYILKNIPKGSYIVVFEYDNEKYELAKYKAEGISESKNSDVFSKTMSIDNNKREYAVTDEIKITDRGIYSIDIGLKEIKIFDLKLEKFINKVTVQNNQGTTTTEYNNAKLAKAEIHAKQINGTLVIVEYKIKVTNAGEVEGYAKKIVDYLSTDYKFDSKLNTDWYQSGNYIYNTSLANEKIKPGESKEIKLVVTKTMTANNTGLVNNTAEIAESYNEKGIKDINSTPGNNINGENDQDSADLILNIKTGEIISYILLVIVTILIVIIIIYFIYRKTIYKKEEVR